VAVDSQRAEALAASVKNRVFPYAEQNNKENAPLFLWLASNSKDENVVIASLDGMAKTWTPSPEYAPVVEKLLGADSQLIQAAALEAAKPPLRGQPTPQALQEKVMAMADSHPQASARLEALNALSGVKDFQQNEKIAALFLKNLDASEPYLKSLALFRIQFNNYHLARQDEFYARARALLKDPDPGVRGRAAEVASVLVPQAEKETLGAELTQMLEDKQAYVRSASADALGRLGYKPAIPKIVALLDDKSSNTYDISYTRLSGLEGSEHHDGSAWSRVDDSMLWALSQLTFSLGPQKFPYGKIDYKNVDGDVAREVRLAKAWYAKNKDLLK
jgi:HEAT repeat protein